MTGSFVSLALSRLMAKKMTNAQVIDAPHTDQEQWIYRIVAAQVILGIVASAIVMWFSRQREFRADAGGADLAGRHKMVSALRRLQQSANQPHLPEQLEAFGISGGMDTSR